MPEVDTKKCSVYDQEVYERAGGNYDPSSPGLHGAFLGLGKFQAFMKAFSSSDNQGPAEAATPLSCLLPLVCGTSLHSN